MLHIIQSNIDDRYQGGDPFTEPKVRSVTVVALGTFEEANSSDTRELLRSRACELLGMAPTVEADTIFNAPGKPAIEIGASIGVEIAGHRPHLVRIVDGPMEEESLVVVRLIGTHRWV